MDTSSDQANCGGCARPCNVDAGQACAGGTCAQEVPVGPTPAACVNGGEPIELSWDGGPGVCAGLLAQVTFRWALCTCQDLTNLSAPLLTDGFDSTQGPYAPDGGGAGVGCNGDFSGSSTASVGGTFWVGGDGGSAGGVSGSEVMVVKQDVEVGGPLSVHSLVCEGDADVEGDVTVNNSSDIAGVLTIDPGSAINGPLDAGSLVTASLDLGTPCDCSASEIVPVAAIVAARAGDAGQNDDGTIGLSPDVFAHGTPSGSRLDLPCGNYYLSGIGTSGPVTIMAHGNVALYIGGDVVPSAPLTLTLDPSSNLDIFIAGNLCASSTLIVGNANYPAQMRLYVGGDDACGNPGEGVRLSGQNTLSTNLYTSHGMDTSAPLTEYGSLFSVGDFSLSAPVTVHFDRAVLGAGAACPSPDAGGGCQSCRDCGNQACIGGKCGQCNTNSDCCAPLICSDSGACVPAACQSSGQSCEQSSDCCHGLRCVSGDVGCDGQSDCACAPGLE